MEKPKPKINLYEEMSTAKLKSEKNKTIKNLIVVGSASAYLVFDFARVLAKDGLAHYISSADSLLHGFFGLLGISVSLYFGRELKNLKAEINRRKIK